MVYVIRQFVPFLIKYGYIPFNKSTGCSVKVHISRENSPGYWENYQIDGTSSGRTNICCICLPVD